MILDPREPAHPFAMDSSIVLEEAVEEGNLYTSAVAEVWIYLSTSVHRGASGRIGAHRGASGRIGAQDASTSVY